ncbi:13-hydroxylupanine O-tigloyltransferase [Cajanus cajan]|nr:13-hydroxylupanine O-tigloyltransferase [Cajanus cajan]
MCICVVTPLCPTQRSFFFDPKEIASMRALLPHHLAAKSTTFEVLTAWLWRSRTTSLEWPNPNQEVRLLFVVNSRFGHFRVNPPLPEGFYDNAFVSTVVVTTLEKLLDHPLGYSLELVKKAKYDINEEYVQSEVEGSFWSVSFLVSDLTKDRLTNVDFGWGKAMYSGASNAGLGESMLDVSYYVPYTNSKGE